MARVMPQFSLELDDLPRSATYKALIDKGWLLVTVLPQKGSATRRMAKGAPTCTKARSADT
jgi:hypothetical protein